VLDTVDILSNQLQKMGTAVIALIPSLLLAMVILSITWAMSRSTQSIAARIMRSSRVGANLRGLIETAVNVAIWVIGILLALTILLPGLTPSSLIAGLGLTSVAIGFAFKDIFENFLAGVIIMLRNKMRIGDTISCEGIQGKIEHISLRETNIRLAGDELVIMPNSMLFKNPVEVFTNRQLRRQQLLLKVDPDTALAPLSTKVMKVVKAVEGVDEAKDVRLYATEMAGDGMTLALTWWTPAKGVDNHGIRDAVVRAIQPMVATCLYRTDDVAQPVRPKLKGVSS
jgi:small conductance mechanosensitive channel